ncbi:hypothetical protein CUC43_32055 (plasmid) [Bacillus thuringiensis LM1212]|nr:hypothetical protein CUC43_32055 [Bacillus thuringiensis LM1212]
MRRDDVLLMEEECRLSAESDRVNINDNIKCMKQRLFFSAVLMLSALSLLIISIFTNILIKLSM